MPQPLPPAGHHRCRRHTATIDGTLLPLLLSVGVEDDACYTKADSSHATLVHAVCQGSNVHALFDRPLPAGCAGGKGGNNDGGTGGGGQAGSLTRLVWCVTTQEEWYATEVLKRRIKIYRSDIIVRLV